MTKLALLRRLILLPFVVSLILVNMAHARVSGLPDFTGLVEQHATAVVNISTTKQQAIRHGLPPGMEIPELPEDSPFGDFLRRFFGDQGDGEELFNSTSLGSGFIISEDGYVITNHHVVKGADEIIVRLSDRREYVAEVIGSDKRSDIALLKVDARGLPTVKLGSSKPLKVGEWVLAIGSPFGFDHSVTAGIVSAKGRSLPDENYVPFIQTDVAINPGNSGGPLFNLDGEVVGINSQIYSRTGGFMGLSFAIPVEVAMNVTDQLKDSGKVSRGWLGVYIQEVTRQLAESFGMDKPAGALVAKVMEDSPAEKAGIKVGDVVVSFEDNEISKSANLPPMVGRARVGEKVKLTLMRDGKLITVKVKIGELPEEERAEKADSVDGSPKAKDSVFGMQLDELDDEQRKHLGIDKGGLMVMQVEEGPAKKAGIRRGDVLHMINGEVIDDVKQLTKLVDDLPVGKFASLLVQRSQGPEFVAIKKPAP